METHELIKIWKTLAENKLVDKKIVKENIQEILSAKRGGIINRMIKKSGFDIIIFLSGLILIPVLLTVMMVFFPGPFPNLQSFVGLTAVELFFIYMLSASYYNRKFLRVSFNELSIKDSIVKINSYLKNYLKRYLVISLVFGYIFLAFAMIQFISRIEGIRNISFSGSGFTIFASRFIVIIFLLMIIWPLLIKLEIKIRYAQTVNDISKLLDELNEER